MNYLKTFESYSINEEALDKYTFTFSIEGGGYDKGIKSKLKRVFIEFEKLKNKLTMRSKIKEVGSRSGTHALDNYSIYGPIKGRFTLKNGKTVTDVSYRIEIVSDENIDYKTICNHMSDVFDTECIMVEVDKNSVEFIFK
jgi:hypothetical protein